MDETERRKLADKAINDIMGEPEERTVLPLGWKILNLHENGGSYTNGRLGVLFNAAVSGDGKIVAHAAVRRVDSKRPTWDDMSSVKRVFFKQERGRVVENNRLFKTSELTRNLWQVIGEDELQEDAVAQVVAPTNME